MSERKRDWAGEAYSMREPPLPVARYEYEIPQEAYDPDEAPPDGERGFLVGSRGTS